MALQKNEPAGGASSPAPCPGDLGRDGSSGGARPRSLRHRGRPATPRRETCGFEAVPIHDALRAGERVIDALARIVAQTGCEGAVLTLEGGRGEPFRFVGPALSTDGLHAAWYTGTVEAEGGAAFRKATAIVGSRDGAPFVHCHGGWRLATGELRFGHLLNEETIVTAAVAVSGFGSRSSRFDGVADEETNFTLFSPMGPDVRAGAFFLRVRPHEDIATAVETECRLREIDDAVVLGLGSLIGTVFEDGDGLDGPVTEVAIEDGTVAGGTASLVVTAVDIEGVIKTGRLRRGENRVGVTFELAVVGQRGAASE